MKPLILIGKRLPPLDPALLPKEPDWVQCKHSFIQKALRRSQALPSGGWFVVDASQAITAEPKLYRINGQELIACRLEDGLLIASHACPHLSGPLASGRIVSGRLVCPWHGLELSREGHGRWRPYPAYDDGVLSWVRLDSGKGTTEAPILPPRPEYSINAVIRREARCDPQDVIANRLDPWHGAHLHPHTFARLAVTSADAELLRVRVAYRIRGRLCIEVDATFHTPEPRTIVMTIVDGEGAGSIVETHAAPIAPGRTAIIEAVMAASKRKGFHRLLQAKRLLPLIQRGMERRAERLWVEDAAYAERTCLLRNG